jgi:hypothetical protein
MSESGERFDIRNCDGACRAAQSRRIAKAATSFVNKNAVLWKSARFALLWQKKSVCRMLLVRRNYITLYQNSLGAFCALLSHDTSFREARLIAQDEFLLSRPELSELSCKASGCRHDERCIFFLSHWYWYTVSSATCVWIIITMFISEMWSILKTSMVW